MAMVAAAAGRVAFAWQWEERFGRGSEPRGDVLRREVRTQAQERSGPKGAELVGWGSREHSVAGLCM